MNFTRTVLWEQRAGMARQFLLVFLLFPLVVLSARSQYSEETFTLKQASEQYDERGFLKGQVINVDGNMAVSNVNGGLSYSYTLDNFTQRGYGFRVGLNYCNSVAMSSFKQYNGGTASGGSGGGTTTVLDYWDKFTRNHPMWVIDVNGFAVQTLSLASDYRPPTRDGIAGNTCKENDVPWLIEGYDFCNRMNRLENTGQYDVISLLRGDGSVLELRNRYKYVNSGVPYGDLVTGHYFEDAVGSAGWAEVDYDTVRIESDLLQEVRNYIAIGGNWKNQYYQQLPRRVRYYQGDGLEYVFVEHRIPYGYTNYNGDEQETGAKTAGPTIFYLVEINDASGVVMNLQYSRHTNPEDGTPGRALIKDIGEYIRFGYGTNYITVQAHGRTTTMQLEQGIPLDMFDAYGGNEGQKLSYIGMIKNIRDPEQRLTEFGYKSYKRTFVDYKHPYDDISQMIINSKRLESIYEPAARYAISYYEGSTAEQTLTFVSNPTPTQALAEWRLNNVVSEVRKSDSKNTWLSTEKYCFDGLDIAGNACDNPVVGDPHTTYTLEDRRTLKTKTITYTFHKWEMGKYDAESAPHPLALPLVFTGVTGVVEEADGKMFATTTDYAQQGSAALVLPVSTETLVSPSSGGSVYRTSKKTMSYETASGHGFGGLTAIADMYTAKVTKKTETVYNPDNGTQVLLRNVTEYQHLPYLSTPQNVAQVKWDKIASLARYNTMYTNGQINCLWEDFPDSLQVLDTLAVRKFYAPPFFGLQKGSYLLDGTGRYLGGSKTAYEQTSITPGQNRRGLRLSDSLIAENRADSVLVAEYHYGSEATNNGGYGWFSDERFPVWQKNGAGARQEQQYRFATRGIPSALLVNDDGTTKNQELYDRLLALGIEKPLIERKLVRNARTGQTDTLQMRNEWTYYGLLGGQGDYNGYYSRFTYDNNGRLKTAQLPKDFLGAPTTCIERVDGKEDYVAPITWTDQRKLIKQQYCPGGTDLNNDSHTTDQDYVNLTAGNTVSYGPCGTPPTPLLSGGTSATTQMGGKRGTETVLSTGGTVSYTARQDDVAIFQFETTGVGNLFASAQTLRGGSFRFLITSMYSTCFIIEVYVRDSANDTLARRSYALNCPIIGPPIGLLDAKSSKRESTLDVPTPVDYMFDIPFTLTELSDIQQSGGTCYVEVIIRTPSARITIAKQGEDKAPHWRLDGVFNLPRAQQQYTVSYEYTPKTDAAVIQRVKNDDRYTRVNFPSGECRSVRYSETRHELGLDRVVEKSELKIGDPTNPTRTDSVKSLYTGLGKAQTTTDQEGYKVGTVYDNWGRALKVTNEDSTYTVVTYAYGNPLTLVGDNDQDFLGYCERVTTRVYAKNGSYVGGMPVQYYDAFGRLRRELRDSVNPQMGMTKYEYDVQNRLTTVVNPEGDTTRYWYDGYGRVKYKYQPDMGYISYQYDALGQVRFTQSQQQHQEGKLTFTEYDDLGRVTLVGEARFGGEPGGGGHALTGGGENGGTGVGKEQSSLSPVAPPIVETRTVIAGKREQTLSFPPHPTLNLNRLTDQLSGRVLHDNSVSTAPTANATVWLPAVNMSYMPQFWTLNQLSQTECIPQPITEPPVVPYLAHPATQYSDPGLPQSTVSNFENISMFPQNARMAVAYDALPESMGSVWLYFPNKVAWDALAPKGAVRNVKGKESAVAYRQHAGEPYHYVVMSYDERGRVEALLRYTENLGFDAVYYTYNSQNAIVSIRAVDPLRQYTTWYGYDWNGRVDSVWTKLSASGNGLGVVNPKYVLPQSVPDSADMVYTYTKRGQIATQKYPLVNTVSEYAYTSRKFLDSMLVRRNSVQEFVQALKYNEKGMIVEQQYKQGTNARKREEYGYNYSTNFLTDWMHDNTTLRSYSYDLVGNRTSEQYALQRVVGNVYADATGPNRLSYVGDSSWQSGVWAETAHTAYGYNHNGSLTSKVWTSGATSISEGFVYDNVQGLVTKYTKSVGIVSEDWRYRYSASGEREQKRLYTKTSAPSKEWTYYLLDGAKRQLAVYRGIETSQTSCSTTVEPQVYFRAMEYLSYGVGSVHSLTTKLKSSTAVVKEYSIQDHLGSTRMVILRDDLKNVSIPSRFDYEPFGGILWQSGLAQRQGFIDKEIDVESGLGDYGERKYDSERGIFNSTDRLWEKYRDLSPYHYCANNPLIFIDPTGQGLNGAPSNDEQTGGMGGGSDAGTSVSGGASGGAAAATGLRALWEWGKDKVSSAWQATKEVAKGVWDGGKEIVKGLVGKADVGTNLTQESVRSKLNGYLLNLEHPKGGSKAQWFKEALGYTKDNVEQLAKQIIFDPNKAVLRETTQYGPTYNQVISIVGANNKVIDVTFAWIRNNDGVVRLVTAIPAKR